MDTLKRAIIYTTGAVIVFLSLTIFYYRSVVSDLQNQVTQANAAYSELMASWRYALAEAKGLRVDNGKLTAELTDWRTRPEPLPEIITDTVYKKIPADCKKCIDRYRLDKEYTNPPVDKVPAKVIKVSIEDVLGEDRATWTLDGSKLCPVVTCPPFDSVIPPVEPVDRLEGRFIFETGLGYGLAGTEANVGLYPLALEYKGYEVDLGGWAVGTLRNDGNLDGNAVLGIKLRKLGSWGLKSP